uniref:Lateral signaling target protein 2 homolog n=1 Tax=Syphacia muris TaxID=451379 RepID=A0A158R3X4_9BILA
MQEYGKLDNALDMCLMFTALTLAYGHGIVIRINSLMMLKMHIAFVNVVCIVDNFPILLKTVYNASATALSRQSLAAQAGLGLQSRNYCSADKSNRMNSINVNIGKYNSSLAQVHKNNEGLCTGDNIPCAEVFVDKVVCRSLAARIFLMNMTRTPRAILTDRSRSGFLLQRNGDHSNFFVAHFTSLSSFVNSVKFYAEVRSDNSSIKCSSEELNKLLHQLLEVLPKQREQFLANLSTLADETAEDYQSRLLQAACIAYLYEFIRNAYHSSSIQSAFVEAFCKIMKSKTTSATLLKCQMKCWLLISIINEQYLQDSTDDDDVEVGIGPTVVLSTPKSKQRTFRSWYSIIPVAFFVLCIVFVPIAVYCLISTKQPEENVYSEPTFPSKENRQGSLFDDETTTDGENDIKRFEVQCEQSRYALVATREENYEETT